MGNYSATIVQIDNLRKHSNADRLQCTNIFGNNVIVGPDTKVGDIGIFFPMESQIGEEFAVANDLIRRKDPETGKPAGGMFDQNRRVRAQTFRGEKSMGFWCPIEYLYKLPGINPADFDLHPGDEFEELGGMKISTKYVVKVKNQPPAPGKKGKTSKKVSKMIDGQFRFHFDTAQLGKNIHRINPHDIISVSWKLHGTSAIASRVICRKELKWWEKVLKKLGAPIVDTEWDHIYASRRVVKNDNRDHNHFYGTDLWSHAGEKLKPFLHAGETVYFEIVGYTPDGKAIQKGYDYGYKEGEYGIYIYRITYTNVEGKVIELPYFQVEQRAVELGVNACPSIYYGRAGSMFSDLDEEAEDWNAQFLNHLQRYFVFDQDCHLCKNKVPAEGIVLRVEGTEINNFKLKSFRFYKWESKQLDSGEADMESAESLEEAA